MTENQKQIQKIIAQYNLSPLDLYIHKDGFKVIRRTGLMKIKEKLKIHKLELELSHTNGVDQAVVKCMLTITFFNENEFPLAGGLSIGVDKTIVTFGEANPKNNTFNYPVAVAQNRALGRAVIEATSLAQHGWITEDDIDFQVKDDIVKDKNEKTAKKGIDATLEAIKKNEKNKSKTKKA